LTAGSHAPDLSVVAFHLPKDARHFAVLTAQRNILMPDGHILSLLVLCQDISQVYGIPALPPDRPNSAQSQHLFDLGSKICRSGGEQPTSALLPSFGQVPFGPINRFAQVRSD
jgi:hypothetical protein